VRLNDLLKARLRVLEARLRMLEADRAELLTAREKGETLKKQGKYGEALKEYEKAVALAERVDGAEDPNMATLLDDLAGLYHALGDNARAEPLYRQSLKIREAKLGKLHPDLAQSLNNLGALLEAQGQYIKAEQFCKDALAMNQALYPKDHYPRGHPSLAQSLNNLGALLAAQGEYVKAESFCKDALAMNQALYPKDHYPPGHPELANSLNNLGFLLQAQGEYAKAEPLYQQALAIQKQALGDKHPQYADTLTNLARLFEKMGRYERALTLLQQSLEIRKATLGPENPLVAQNLSKIEALERLRVGTTVQTANLDETLLKQAPTIIEHLRGQKYEKVGVLKFLLKKGDAVSDSAGLLGVNLANRLQVALVLATDEDLKIIQDASATVAAAQNQRASHLSEEGREALFDVPYNLAWGASSKVKANAFVTGYVEMAPDLKTMTVTIQAFDKRQSVVDEVCKFDVAVDGRTLSEAGKSYNARGPGNILLATQAINSAASVDQGKEPYPLEAPGAPVKLRILYNGQEVPFAKGTVKEPKEGQEVVFQLENMSKETCGVVLKVNGESTLFRQRLPSSQCYKWILTPGEKVTIQGFQLDKGQAQKFVVKSPPRLGKGEVSYGEDLGTFSVDVFLEKRKDVQPVKPTEEVIAIGRGTLAVEGKIRPGTLKALQSQLKDRGVKDQEGGCKGIVVAGDKIRLQVENTPIELDPTPVLSQTIRYYQPR
jgi:tetratricopeptide (TPR) repeat protein